MQLLVSARDRLRQRYGAAGHPVIMSALEAYRDQVAGRAGEAELLFVDAPESVSRWDEDIADASQWESVWSTIRSVCRRATVEGRPVRSITLLGGPTVVPFCRVPNPLHSRGVDRDAWILTDALYAADDRSPIGSLQARRSIGRIPDGGTRSVAAFLKILASVQANYQTPFSRSGACAIVAAEFSDKARRVAQRLPPAVTWRSCPNYRVTQGTRGDLARRYIFSILHGRPNDARWWAWDNSRTAFVEALHPRVLRQEEIAGSVIFAENCYGAHIEGRTVSNSCALRALSEGAAVFVGATGLAFGSYLPPEEFGYSDELAERFLANHVAGMPAGEALRQARSGYFGKAVRDGRLDDFESKTALQFILLGDPLL